MTTIYGVALSPFVRKVRIALLEKGIDYELEPVMPMPPHNDTPEFRKMSPLGKIPALRDGDFTISDSSVILNYLDRKHPATKLIPADAEECARALWLEELADTRLIENIGPVFFNRIVKPAFMNEEPDQTAIDAALQALPPLFEYFEEQLVSGEVLVGTSFSVADVSLGSMLRQYQLAGESLDAAHWPKLTAYWDRISARPSFEKVVADENATMAAMGAGS